ncbi:hypothetical protein [Undibacterium sp. TS12]|uniref:hypothetical protein n=1 Tax=Undibacterium sp. TS12 TaxID=2908202 RepID=UPI001F4CC9BF|nr:hypothetical protein [Undibacterium sp. TS12]MCH8622340.1 hypothetical protein [Undibacterium sp. TS12]
MISFLVLLLLFWDSNKAQQGRLAFRSSVLHWSARTRASGILKTAKKSAPFHAEYDFRGDTVVYHRAGAEKASFVWSRKLTGFLLVGHGYTLLFKKEKSLNPYAIFLHEADDGLLPYLEELGIKKLAIAAGNA